MSVRGAAGQLYEVGADLTSHRKTRAFGTGRRTLLPGPGRQDSDSRSPEFDGLSGITANYLGENVANIYGRPDRLGGRLFQTADASPGQLQTFDDKIMRRSDQSFNSAHFAADFYAGQPVGPAGVNGINGMHNGAGLGHALNGVTIQPGLFGGEVRPGEGTTKIVNLGYSGERKMSIGSHDGVIYGGNITGTQVHQPGTHVPTRPALSDAGSRSSSARRVERSSWYSNKQNDYDWVTMDRHDIRKFKVFSKGYYVVKTHEDTEVEKEFTLEDWRRENAGKPKQVQVLKNPVFEAIPRKLSLPMPTGTREAEQEELRRFQGSFGNKAPSVSSQATAPQDVNFHQDQLGQPQPRPVTATRGMWPESQPGKILNSEDLKMMLQKAGAETVPSTSYEYSRVEISPTPIGKTEQGDDVYGFDAKGRPVISVEQDSGRPIFGYTLSSRSPVYGFSEGGYPQTHFDSMKRPVIGFDSAGRPVYDLKRGRFLVRAFGKSAIPMVGLTRDKKPVFDISPSGYIATSVDPASGQLCYGVDWKWRPLLEQDISEIQNMARDWPVVARDERGAKVFGTGDMGNPIYSFSKDKRPIYGFTTHGHPVMGVASDGNFVLTFDPDSRPVFGFDQANNPLYDPSSLQRNAVIYFPPGVEFASQKWKRLLDVWGRDINKEKVTPVIIRPGHKPERGDSFDNQYDLFDETGAPIQHIEHLLDHTGDIIPDRPLLTNQHGQLISEATPVYNSQGQKISPKVELKSVIKPVMDYKGNQIGYTFDGKTVVDEDHKPIAILSEQGQLRSLLPVSEIKNHKIEGSQVKNKEGVVIGTITSEGVVQDLKGIPFGMVSKQGVLQVDSELAQALENSSRLGQEKTKFTPHLVLSTENVQEQHTLVPDMNQNLDDSRTSSNVFVINSLGKVFDMSGNLLGTVNHEIMKANPNSIAEVRDSKGNIVAKVDKNGSIVSLEGHSLGILNQPTSQSMVEDINLETKRPEVKKELTYANTFQPPEPKLTVPEIPQQKFKVGPNFQLLDTSTGQSLGSIGEIPKNLQISPSIQPEKCLFDQEGKVSAILTRDGKIVSLDGSTLGSLSQAGSNRSIDTWFMSEDGKPIGTFDKKQGVFFDPAGKVIARKSKDGPAGTQFIDESGRELFSITPSGEMNGLLRGISVDNGVYDRIKRGETLPASEIKDLLDEAHKSPLDLAIRAAKRDLSGLTLLDKAGRPIGKVDSLQRVVDNQGRFVGQIEPDGKLYDPSGKQLPFEDGALVDDTGKMVAMYTDQQGLTSNGGKSIFSESKNPAPQMTQMSVGGYSVDSKGQLLDKEGLPVARLVGSQVVTLEGRPIARMNAEGELEDMAGNRIDDQGRIVNMQGSKLGEFHLIPNRDLVIPLSKKLPVIADVEGHRIIGINQNGDFIIGIDEKGKPILGKAGFDQAGVKVAAIDIEGKPLPPTFVEDAVKISLASHDKKTKDAKVLTAIVPEEDEDKEDTDRIIKTRNQSSRAHSNRHVEEQDNVKDIAEKDEIDDVKDSDPESEEEEDEAEDEELMEEAGGSTRNIPHKLVKTESFINVPGDGQILDKEFEAAKQKEIENELGTLTNAREELEKAIQEQESIANSPIRQKSRQELIHKL